MKAKLILLAAAMMIAGCAYGQKKTFQEPFKMPDAIKMQTFVFSNSPALTSMKIVATKKEGGHWELQDGYTLDDLMEVVTKNANEAYDRCQADQYRILNEWRKSLKTPSPKKPVKTSRTKS